ncbi:AsmA protein [Novimethylophilus kurashikiensis]|uniref:AsmA protein n=1 Tax=Novimethylophilus kurashikiensis TaxID=1825523 RepID=A0A2R5F7B3_9PROT|nr:AsmA family protein [Novimethylophilus kurashikiensis]GBG13935.1 AsmA protein [Novimethylophilus kurashikiensis]
MNKAIKYSLIGIGGLFALLLAAVGIVAATFNPNDYKPLIVKLVKEKKQRTLIIEGDIKLAFWPKLGADLGKVSLSEHNDGKEFASMQSAKVFLALMPLLKKELVVDTIKIDGVHANIVRFKDGTTNFDDLLSKEESSTQIKFDIDGVQVTNTGITLDDQQGNRHFAIDQLDLTTGHVALNQPIDLKTSFHVKGDNPNIDAKLNFKGNLLADTEHKHYVAKGLDLALAGDVTTAKALDLKLSGDVDAKPETMEFLVDSLKLAAKTKLGDKAIELTLNAPSLTAQKDTVSGKEARIEFTQTQGDDKTSVKMVIADLKGSPKAFQSSGISGEISGSQGKRSLSGKFSSPFSGDLENKVFDLPKLAGNVDIKDPALPSGAAKVGFNLNAHADVKKELAAVTLAANVDGSKLDGNVGVSNFSKPNVTFKLAADQLDLNKLLGASKPKTENKQSEPGKPADLSALKNVLAQGTLNIGSIAYDKYRISNLAATVKADGQALSVNPLSLKFDDSQIKGRIGITHFERALYTFDLDIDRVDADRYVPQNTAAKAAENGPAKPLDLSALKALNADGSLRIGSLKYGKTQASNIRVDLKADGNKLDVNPFSAKVDDSQVKAVLGITRFQNPQFSFNVDIDKLDADRYVTKKEPAAKAAPSTADTPIDLSALKTLNANGEARVGWLKVANVKTSNVHLGVKADGGVVALAPFAADLYQGHTEGSLNVDARAVPAIAFKQDMKNVAVGPLLVDAINNDMLEGKGNVAVDIKTQGATVGALKKALNGNAAVNLADGAIKGIDIAGTIRDVKNKFNFSGNTLGADQKKKTDFSEMKATFKITNGVAHNDDLDIKSPLLRIAGSGDIDIGNEKLNYTAKPTVVSSLKGQGGADIGALNGLTFPVKVGGTFSAPKYNLDFAAIGAAVAQKNLLGNVGGQKGEAVQKLLGGDKAGALEGLIGGKKKQETPATSAPAAPNATAPAQTAPAAPADNTQQQTAPAQPEKKLTPEEKAKKKLNKLLGL